MTDLSDKLKEAAELRNKRLEICNSCPEFNKVTTQCNKCGCIMSIKTIIKKTECPLGKW